MKRRTTQNLARLKKLAATAVENLYERIGLAVDVMSDLDWIATVHGGSNLKAADALTDEFFRDLGGYVSLGKLMAMHREVEQPEWEELRYDVAAVEAVYDDRHRETRETHEKGERTSWKKVAEERGKRIEELERQIEELERQIKQLLAANESLRDDNDKLTRDVARLEGRIEEMGRRRREMVEV